MFNRETIKRSITILTIVLVTVIIIGYSYYASHGIIAGPSITVISPFGDQTSFSTSTINIKGVAKRTQSITLNGRPILIDETGNFTETIILSSGYNVETLQGVDKFGHTTTTSLQLIYRPH